MHLCPSKRYKLIHGGQPTPFSGVFPSSLLWPPCNLSDWPSLVDCLFCHTCWAYLKPPTVSLSITPASVPTLTGLHSHAESDERFVSYRVRPCLRLFTLVTLRNSRFFSCYILWILLWVLCYLCNSLCECVCARTRVTTLAGVDV